MGRHVWPSVLIIYCTFLNQVGQCSPPSIKWDRPPLWCSMTDLMLKLESDLFFYNIITRSELLSAMSRHLNQSHRSNCGKYTVEKAKFNRVAIQLLLFIYSAVLMMYHSRKKTAADATRWLYILDDITVINAEIMQIISFAQDYRVIHTNYDM